MYTNVSKVVTWYCLCLRHSEPVMREYSTKLKEMLRYSYKIITIDCLVVIYKYIAITTSCGGEGLIMLCCFVSIASHWPEQYYVFICFIKIKTKASYLAMLFYKSSPKNDISCSFIQFVFGSIFRWVMLPCWDWGHGLWFCVLSSTLNSTDL